VKKRGVEDDEVGVEEKKEDDDWTGTEVVDMEEADDELP